MIYTATKKLLLPAAALTGAAMLLMPAEPAVAYSTLGSNLPYTQRDFRIHNNFADAASNNNTTEDPNFPGYTGVYLAFWKGAVEWASELHGGSGSGDPHQSGGLGSGGANFDGFMGGESSSIGGTTHNIVSAVSSCSSGVLAYCESTGLGGAGWRIRFCESWTWADGPGTGTSGGMDIQGVACHEYGHALGLGHSTVGSATMYPSASGNGVPGRSIASDDIAGVQFIYGVRNANKPKIMSVASVDGFVTITGSGFSSAGNEVWFTPAASSGAGGAPKIVVSDVTSDGTTITVGVPVEAGPGNVMVKNNGNNHRNMSNAWPTALGGGTGGGTCETPTNYCTSTPNSGSPFG
ncbi:MAG: M10 family metallopeptidase domain-containing protein, partial [Planctomycetes bacterium]|nr:M10 family metallopeptidase domain-containing protein [Planctomycetota bacterium]